MARPRRAIDEKSIPAPRGLAKRAMNRKSNWVPADGDPGLMYFEDSRGSLIGQVDLNSNYWALYDLSTDEIVVVEDGNASSSEEAMSIVEGHAVDSHVVSKRNSRRAMHRRASTISWGALKESVSTRAVNYNLSGSTPQGHYILITKHNDDPWMLKIEGRGGAVEYQSYEGFYTVEEAKDAAEDYFSSRRAMNRRANVEFGPWSVKKFPEGWANSEIWTASSNVGGITGEITISESGSISWSIYLPGGLTGSGGYADSTDEAIEKMKKAPEFGLAWSRNSSMRRRAFIGIDGPIPQSVKDDWEVRAEVKGGDYVKLLLATTWSEAFDVANSSEGDSIYRNVQSKYEDWRLTQGSHYDNIRPASVRSSMRRRAQEEFVPSGRGYKSHNYTIHNAGGAEFGEEDQWQVLTNDYGVPKVPGVFNTAQEAMDAVNNRTANNKGANMDRMREAARRRANIRRASTMKRKAAARECVWTYSGEDDGGNLHYWDCQTHGYTEAGGLPPNDPPSYPCEGWLDEVESEHGPYQGARKPTHKTAYQGWTNWDTWNAALWINNKKSIHRRDKMEAQSPEELKQLVIDLGITGDGFDVNAVNWDEVWIDIDPLRAFDRGLLPRASSSMRRREKRASMNRKAESYQGWTNWDTWNASLWINNEEGIYRAAVETQSPEELRQLVQDFGLTGDGFDPDKVNWNEVWTDSEFGTTASVRPSRRRRDKRASMRRRAETNREYINRLVQEGILSPAARDMDPQDAVYQYNESNALDEEDEDFLRLPKSSRNQRGARMNQEERAAAARRRARMASMRRRADGVAPANDLGDIGGEVDPENGVQLEPGVDREDVTKREHTITDDETDSQYDEAEYDNQGGKQAPANGTVAPANEHNAVKAMRLADLFLEIGTISKDEKYAKIAEFERLPNSILADRIKTAEEIVSKLPKREAQKTASGRVPKPSLAPKGMSTRHSSQENSEDPLLFF